MHNYLRHGGRLFGTQLTIKFHLNRIPDLLRISEPWLVEDLSSLEICLIGTMTHVDVLFRDQIKKALASYHSPISSSRESFADNVFKSIFGKASIKGHFRALYEYQRYRFLSLLCETGSTSMVTFVLDVGSDISGHWRNWNYSDLLVFAAAGGNVDVVSMLLEAGAESSFALRQFLEHSSHLPNGVFRRILWTLVENARSAPFHRSRDPVISIMRSSKALSLHPKASEILLNRKIFTDIGLGRGAAHIYNYDSYMYHAIKNRQHSVVDLLFQNGAMVDATIWGQNSCPWESFESCTFSWLR